MASRSKPSSASSSTKFKITADNKPYRPYGAAKEILYAKDDEVLLSGPAGTGKSRAILEKLHIVAEKYPGCRILIVRKTRVSLTESALVTFEQNVVPAGHPILEGAQRGQRKSYKYPNGSEIVIGGMDKPVKIMSTEYDIAYGQEAIEFSENDIESITTRLRNGVVPYQQLLMDTNPDRPTHWLIQRCHRGQTRLIECRHEDNPVYWDHAKGDYTEAGRKYIVGKLEKLSGVRLQRLRYGRWVAAEGLVYDSYDSAIHLVDRDSVKVEASWPRLWTVDWGFSNPFVWQEWVIDPDGRMYRWREIYKTRSLVEDLAKQILRVTAGDPKPVAIVVDHDAEDRATFERHIGMKTIAAHKAIRQGIEAVEARLRDAGDGKPRLFLVRDALVERDPELVEAKRPCCTEEEIDGYVWPTVNPDKANRKADELPVDKDNHGMDAMRYGVVHQDIVGAENTDPWDW